MTQQAHFILMATYNSRMNKQLFQATTQLSESELREDRGAFFGSIIGTLNHILVGDLIWLSRFATHSQGYQSLTGLKALHQPSKLDDMIYPDLASLQIARTTTDQAIERWLTSEVEEPDFARTLKYANTKGIVSERNFGELVAHLFNHQTHHRGQASTLLSQAGTDVGVTDFLIDIPDLAERSQPGQVNGDR